jgi:hypothetical protein
MTGKRGKTQEKLGKGQSLTLCQMLIELGASMCSAWCIQQKMDPTWLTQSIQSPNGLTMKELNVFTCSDSPMRRSFSLIGLYTGQQLNHWPESCILPSQTEEEQSPLDCSCCNSFEKQGKGFKKTKQNLYKVLPRLWDSVDNLDEPFNQSAE